MNKEKCGGRNCCMRDLLSENCSGSGQVGEVVVL